MLLNGSSKNQTFKELNNDMSWRKNMLETIRNQKSKLLIASLLIIIGVVGRLTIAELLPLSPSLYLNVNGLSQPMFMMDVFFFIALISILSGLFLKSYYVFLVPVSVMLITDMILGNNFIFLFTWSGFVLIGFISYLLKMKTNLTIRKTPLILGTGIGGILLYDIWTNFGCFLGWYPHSVEGLTLCFTAALPFMLWHLLSTTIAMMLVVLPIIYLKDKKIIHFDNATFRKEKPIAISLLVILLIISIAFIVI